MKDLTQFTVNRMESIRDAMMKISANRHRAVVVLDEGYVLGTVSDGDIRRALLKDVLPVAPVTSIMNVNCATTTETDPAKQAAALRKAMVTLLPVVDGRNQFLGVALALEPFFEASDD